MKAKPEMGKYLLWQFFQRNPVVRQYLPATTRYGATALMDYLQKYRVVYIKPVAGSRGAGILKAWKDNGKVFVKRTTYPERSFLKWEQAVQYVNSERQQKAYLVQQGIDLAKIDSRPFDIRVMMQRVKPGGPWLYSGMLAKIAGPKSVVTNLALSRGRVVEVEQALRQGLGWGDKQVQRCIREIRALSLTAANHFDTYQYYRELGFDVAVDKNGKIWMIEENTGPSHELFHHLKSNLAMYRRIQFRWGEFNRALQARTKMNKFQLKERTEQGVAKSQRKERHNVS